MSISASRALFPPQPQTIPPPEWRKDGRSTILIQSWWGEVRLPAQVWEHRQTHQHVSTLLDPSLDHSGFTPQALDHLLELSSTLPFERASEWAARFGPTVTRCTLERLTRPYAQQVQHDLRAQLEHLAFEPLDHLPDAKPRVMVIQTDGVFVLGRAAHHEDATVTTTERGNGIEVKTAVVYPQEAPTERFRLAEVCTADQWLPMMTGALRVGGVRQHDVLIGVSDGAIWIEEKFKTLGVTKHVLDVFHSAMYVDTVMQALGHPAEQRASMRRTWLRGDVSAQWWLNTSLPSAEQQRQWPPEAIAAVRYLTARVDMMDYPTYRDNGWPIGSGQIEGMNKSVIGSRMKGSGMHWSRPGASRMASLRTFRSNRHAPLALDALRHRAFPSPAQ